MLVTHAGNPNTAEAVLGSAVGLVLKLNDAGTCEAAVMLKRRL